MKDKEIWEHLSKELAKVSTILDLSLKISRSILLTRSRYDLFIFTVLDAFSREIFLSIYHLFDKKYSWCLYSLICLSGTERKEIQGLRTKFQKYIDIRNSEIGHFSTRVKLEEHKRLHWLPDEELEKLEELFKEVSRFLNAYGMRKFNEGYALHIGGPDTSLQCLIEDLEKVANS